MLSSCTSCHVLQKIFLMWPKQFQTKLIFLTVGALWLRSKTARLQCDFLWDLLEENPKAFSLNIATADEFIEEELLMIPRQFFNNSYDSFLFRYHQCISTDRRQFK